MLLPSGLTSSLLMGPSLYLVYLIPLLSTLASPVPRLSQCITNILLAKPCQTTLAPLLTRPTDCPSLLLRPVRPNAPPSCPASQLPLTTCTTDQTILHHWPPHTCHVNIMPSHPRITPLTPTHPCPVTLLPPHLCLVNPMPSHLHHVNPMPPHLRLVNSTLPY